MGFIVFCFSGFCILLKTFHKLLGQNSSVGIATCYGLDDPGIESRWGRDFPHQSRPAPGSTQTPIKWVRPFFPEGKTVGAWL